MAAMSVLSRIMRIKLPAFTLVQSLLAMVIVMFTMGLFTTIYVNVMKSSDHQRRIQTSLLLDKIAMDTKKAKIFLDEEIKADSFTVEKKVAPYGGASNVSVFSLKVLDKNQKLLAERNELIFTQ